MHSQRAQFERLHLKTLLDVLMFCSVNFALVISLFKFGGCRLLLIIFDVERASRIVWSLLKMCMLFLYIYIYLSNFNWKGNFLIVY